MALQDIIALIDKEISDLQQARARLTGISEAPVAAAKKSGRGRPKGSKNAAKSVEPKASAPAKKSKRNLSPEGRKAIQDAMKKRWAERRKQPTA